MCRKVFSFLFIVGLTSCSRTAYSPRPSPSDDPFSRPPSFRQIVTDAEKSADTDDSTAQLRLYGHQWLYGPGVGRTIANVGTVVLFPPYALYLLGNAGLALAGYEPLYVTSALPAPAREYTLSVYDGITSVPGRLSAGIAGEEFQGKSPPANPPPEGDSANVSGERIPECLQ